MLMLEVILCGIVTWPAKISVTVTGNSCNVTSFVCLFSVQL